MAHVRQVESDGSEGEDGIDRDGTRKPEETEDTADADIEPHGVDWSLGVLVDSSEKASVWESTVAAEGVEGSAILGDISGQAEWKRLNSPKAWKSERYQRQRGSKIGQNCLCL